MDTSKGTTKNINITRIQFPEIKLHTRDAHKLRGYFGNLFKEHSPILHNHWESGKVRYRYPSVQYKVIDQVPMLVGIGEGAELLPQLFLKIKEIDVDGKRYLIQTKNIEARTEATGYTQNLEEYRFKTLWMALNQQNYRKYHSLKDENEKGAMLNSILVGHVLSFFSNMDIKLTPSERLMARVNVKGKTTHFKSQKMIAYTGKFVVNALLPSYIGLGKSVSRGFGTIARGQSNK